MKRPRDDHGQRTHRGGIEGSMDCQYVWYGTCPGFRLSSKWRGGRRSRSTVPTDLPIALMQGAYMDRDRGAAEAVARYRACLACGSFGGGRN